MQNSSPSITIDFRKGRIRISAATLKMLGSPEHISLLINPDSNSIALTPGSWRDSLAHQARSLQERHNYIEVYSRLLTDSLLEADSRFSGELSVQITGTYHPCANIAVFPINDGVELPLKEVKSNE